MTASDRTERDVILLALNRLVTQDRYEAPYADAARASVDVLLAELAAAREEAETLREALQHIASVTPHERGCDDPDDPGCAACIAAAALAAWEETT